MCLNGYLHIIKPAPAYKHLRLREQIPAAENGLVFFRSGEIAYITKRFDYDAGGNKIKQEDFASLARKSLATHGRDFKYTGSYEDAAALLKNYV